jgi:PKD repeat protein
METRLVRIASLFIAVLTLTLMPVTVSAPESPIVANHSENADPAIPPANPITQSGSASAASPSIEPAARARIVEGFGKLPLYFVENHGQLDERVSYYIQGSDKTIYFSPDGVTYELTQRQMTHDEGRTLALRGELDSRSEIQNPKSEIQRWSVKLDFIGANPDVHPIGQDKTEAIISYFKGSPDQWHAGLPTYSRIVYPDLWPGIDLVYYGTVNQLKYEFVVRPGADPAQIRLAYRGADVSLNAKGQLLVTTSIGGFSDDTPVAYQEIDGQRVPVPMAYQVSEASDKPETRTTLEASALYAPPSTLYGFTVGPYDPARLLILDPAVIVYCGYIGGDDEDWGYGIAADGAGNAYVTGSTYSTEASFPVIVGPELTYNGGEDAFVAKVNVAGTGLVYAGYIGGIDYDAGFGIAVDGTGNAYVTGQTWSTEASFPVIGGPDLTFNGQSDAFVAKVNASGSSLVYAGYIGGGSDEDGYGIAVDGAGNAYVTGETGSTGATFPLTGGPDLTFNGGYEDAFVAKVNATGSSLVYAGYIGGNGDDWGYGIAVDGAGNAYVTGETSSTQASFPITGGPDLSHNGGNYDAFVAKVNVSGSGLVYAGYIGGSGEDWGYGIAVDSAGNAYVTGGTSSTEASFPVIGGPDLTYNGGDDAFVAKVNVTGSGLVYAGYVGGNGDDGGSGIAVDGAGNAYVTGGTSSTEVSFPVIGGPDLTYNGGDDAFVAKVNVTGSGLVYAGYIGGSGEDWGYGIAVDGASNAYVTGYTDSTEASFPVVGGPDLTYNGGEDAFVAKVIWYPAGIITAAGNHLERDGVPFEGHGMNYYPKDYAWSRFWISYTLALTQTSEELDRAKALGVNTVRIFLPYNLFDGTSQSAPYLGYLTDFVDRLQARNMVALVTLFDYYPTYSTQPYSTTDYISSTHHISSVLNTLGVTNTAVLAWDIKNELDRDYAAYGKSQVQAWATEMISYTYSLDVDHLVTLGFYGVVTGTPCYTSTPGAVYSPTLAAELASLVDAVSMHYFLPERCFESDLSALQSQVGEKPILLEEFGLHTQSSAPGNPHTETEQAAYYNTLLSLSEAYGVAGYAFWTLNDFSYTLPGLPGSEKCMGILRNSLVNTCQVTTPTNYTPKPAAETIRRHYAEHVAYLDLFDGWVDPKTDLPPAGWADNGQSSGALLRGYNPSNPLWSHDPGKVALTKFVSGSISITGTAFSPVLTDVNVDRYSIVAGQVYSYSIHDLLNGSNSILYVGVKEGTQITPLLTIMPTTTLPYTFTVDLRQAPLNWSGHHNLRIALQLVPQASHNGYSASYELDWIGLLAAPQASFTAWPTVGIAPMTVAFTNTSTGDSTHSQWSFGDGVTSTLASPTHTYMTRGVYTVTLAVNGLGGIDTLTRTNYITVYALARAGFVASPLSGLAPMDVTFTNTSTGDYANSLWSFGDGSTSALTSPAHMYSLPGVYTVTLMVSGPGGTDTLTRANYITVIEPPPAAGFTATPTSGIRPLTVNFSNTSTGVVSTWLWNFGDSVTSTEQHPTHTYTVTGVYTVTLTVSGPGGSDTESKPSFITVQYGVYLPIVLRQNAKLFETALSLDGVDDYASAPDSTSLDLGTGNTDDFTIETFFYVPDLADTSVDTLIWKPGAYGLYIIYDASLPDQLILRIWLDSADDVELPYDVELSMGWHHVAAVFDNETTGGLDLTALYLDGSLVASNNRSDWTPGLPDSTSALYIGGYVGLYPVAGWIEEMRFSDIVRYSGVTYTVPTDSFVNDVNTRALWHFDEAPGSMVLADSSGNGNKLFGQNGAHTGNP